MIYIFTFFDSHQFAVFSPEAMEIVTGEHEEPLFPPINSLTHHSLESIMNNPISSLMRQMMKCYKAGYILPSLKVFNLSYENHNHLEKSRSLCCQRRPFFTALPRPDQDEDLDILPKGEDINTLQNFKSASRLLLKKALSVSVKMYPKRE